MTTQAPAIKAALLAALQAAAPTLQATWGDPGIDDAEADHAFVAEARVAQDWAALGRQRRDETIEISVFVIARSAEPAKDVEQRAWNNAALFEQKLREDPTLADACLWAGVSAAQQLTVADGPEGHAAQVQLTVQARTRI